MSISSASARGASIFTVVNLGTYGLSFVATLIAARLLTPSDFGEAALAITIADVLVVAAAWSMPTALLREPEESVLVAFDTAIYLVLMFGAGVLVVTAAISAGLAIAGLGLVAQMLIAIMGARVLMVLGGCYTADLSRRFLYGRLSGILFVAQVSGNAATVALAASGVGAWSLAAREVVVGLVTIPLSILFSGWHFSRGYRREKARELVDFANKMIGSRIGDLMFHRYDNLVVGALSGKAALGLYSQAYLLAEIGNRAYSPSLLSVGMSNYARTQGNRSFTSRTFHFVNFFLIRTALPLFLVLLLLPTEVLSVLFGERWLGAADMLRGLSVYALLLPFFEHIRGLLIANGLVSEVLRARIVQLAFFVPAVPALVMLLGGEGAGLAVAVAMVIGTVAMARQSRQVVDPIRLQEFAGPALAAALGATALFVAASAQASEAASLVAGIVALLVVYSVTLWFIEGSKLRANLAILKRSLRGGADVNPAEPA